MKVQRIAIAALVAISAGIALAPAANAQAPAGSLEETIPPGENFDKAEFRLWVPDSSVTVRAVVVLVPGSNGDGRAMADDPEWQRVRDEALARAHRLPIYRQAARSEFHRALRQRLAWQRPGAARRARCDGSANDASRARDRAVSDVGHVGGRTVQLRVRRLETRTRRGVRRQQGRHLLFGALVAGRAQRARHPLHRRQGSRVSQQHDRRSLRRQSSCGCALGAGRRAGRRACRRPVARRWR